MKIVAVIPARMNSSRFPGKPLARISGQAMIEHVVRRTNMCGDLDEVYVATCDEEIRAAVEGFGGKVIMTSRSHERASDRVAEAAAKFDADIVVMIQGDEPLVTPAMISSAIAPMREDASVECVNLARRIETREEFENPNVIKVVGNLRGDAVYFSRAQIPAIDFDAVREAPVFKQVCIIPFRRQSLFEFARLEPTPLEKAESIDMLRLVEHGKRIRLVETFEDNQAVDVPEDIQRVEKLMKIESKK